jgi:alpha-D-xyloside xylohydrolase
MPDAPYEIRIYRGADAVFSLYEDAGDDYDYEQGCFSIVTLTWDDARGELHISARAGSFAALVAGREYQLVFISPQGRGTTSLLYTGHEILIAANAQS